MRFIKELKDRDMRLTKITYTQTLNLGDYENEKIELEVTLSEGEDPRVALDRCRKFIKKNRLPVNNNGNNSNWVNDPNDMFGG